MLFDIQNTPSSKDIPIDFAGVTDLRYPIVVLDKKNKKQNTVAYVSMSVNLPGNFKGTHMSRFIEVLNKHRGEITMRTIPKILKELLVKLNAACAKIEVKFPYFIEQEAPKSKSRAIMDYDCKFIGEIRKGTLDFIMNIRVPVTSLCPCSKAISDYGAHNQRGYVDVSIRNTLDKKGKPRFVWFEELIRMAEQSASCPVYPLLKRPDERYVTMQAYNNPAFVEDIVRNMSVFLQKDDRIKWFLVRVDNMESIHNHNVFAVIESAVKIK